MTRKLPRKEMAGLPLAGKRLLIREDLNVPIKDGFISNEARILAALPTLEHALNENAAVLVMSHLGRPEEGQFTEEFSLAPVAARLAELLQMPVPLIADFTQGIDIQPGQIALLENVRFLKGEKANDDALAERLAGLCDIFVMDAFATAHRAQASTHGVARFAETACAGPLLAGELEALEQALAEPRRPLVAIVGGAKVSTKLEVLGALAELADEIIVGGGIANTFIAAAGHAVGQSLHEADLVESARSIAAEVQVPLPVDVMVGKKFSEDETAVVRAIDEVADDEMILDIGPETARRYADAVKTAGTILWNGPVGVFEFDQFGEGTRVLAEGIAASGGYSIAGGGAFLEFVEGKTLPAVAVLAERAT